MAYKSRRYIRDKYEKVKYDLEVYLDILNKDKKDKITDEEANAVKNNVIDNMQAIIKELEK